MSTVHAWGHAIITLVSGFFVGYFSRPLHTDQFKNERMFFIAVLMWAVSGIGLLGYFSEAVAFEYISMQSVYGLLIIALMFPHKKPKLVELRDAATIKRKPWESYIELGVVYAIPNLIAIIWTYFWVDPGSLKALVLIPVAAIPITAYHISFILYPESKFTPSECCERSVWGIYTLATALAFMYILN